MNGLIKCNKCGYNHKLEWTCEQAQEHLDALRASIELSKSGYAGLDEHGNKVDRRQFPNAIPIQENSLFGIPKPKKVNHE